MARALDPPHRTGLIARGAAIAAHHRWDGTAQAHIAAYEQLQEMVDA
jgi:hypothetical protein